MKIFLLLLICIELFAASIDTSIVLDGNVTHYKQLLKKLEQTGKTTDNILLQKSILHELINNKNIQNTKLVNIQSAKNSNEYKNFIKQYIKDCQDISSVQQKLTKIDKNIAIIEKEINSLNAKDPLLLTNELQDAFYHKKKVYLTNSLLFLQKKLSFLQLAMRESLQSKDFKIDTMRVQRDIVKAYKQLHKYKSTMDRLAITIEEEEILERAIVLNTLHKRVGDLQQQYNNYALELITDKFLLFSAYLQEKNRQVFNLQREILKDIQTYKIFNEDIADSYFTPLLLNMETTFLGRIKTMAGSSEEEMKAVVESTWKMLQIPLFHINKTPISIVKLIISIVIFMLGFLLGHLYKSNIQKLSQKSRTITASTATLLSNLGYYAIFLITFFVVLKFLGIDLSSIALVAGALSVGIGFGLQNVISNFVSGIILMVERSIKIGDYIQLDDTLRGKVVDIKMRSITIVTNSNIDVIVPNQDLIQQKVINWTMHDKIRRFEIPFGVAYGTDAKKVRSVVLKAVAESGFQDIYTQDKNRITRVLMKELGNSSVDFELFVWIKGAETLYPKRTTARFLELIYEALNANGIEIPFPQQDLHIKSVSTEIPLIIQNKEKR